MHLKLVGWWGGQLFVECVIPIITITISNPGIATIIHQYHPNKYPCYPCPITIHKWLFSERYKVYNIIVDTLVLRKNLDSEVKSFLSTRRNTIVIADLDYVHRVCAVRKLRYRWVELPSYQQFVGICATLWSRSSNGNYLDELVLMDVATNGGNGSWASKLQHDEYHTIVRMNSRTI